MKNWRVWAMTASIVSIAAGLALLMTEAVSTHRWLVITLLVLGVPGIIAVKISSYRFIKK
ncbi:MAG: hypothetical protein ACYTG4_06960 [Planctomycetota bacterium]|jgi:hypothetical protein